jgi:hypothetical protein
LKSVILDDGCSQDEYIREVLEAYRKVPRTMAAVRRVAVAAELYDVGSCGFGLLQPQF